jgi:hypothetical protein
MPKTSAAKSPAAKSPTKSPAAKSSAASSPAAKSSAAKSSATKSSAAKSSATKSSATKPTEGSEPSRETKALLAAARRSNARGLDAALDAGASLAGRDEQGFTALHIVSRAHQLPLALQLVARGGDPWAGSYGPADGFRPIGFFGPEDAAQLAAAAEARGLPSPRTERLAVLCVQPERRVVTFETHPSYPGGADADQLRAALRAGADVASAWPADVSVAPGKFRSPEDVELRDLLEGGPTGFLVSDALATALTTWRGGLLQGAFQLLPVVLLDEAGRARERRSALHVLAVPALDLSPCFPKANLVNRKLVSDVAAHAFRPGATDGLHLFRAAEYPPPVFVSRELAAACAGFSGVATRDLRR